MITGGRGGNTSDSSTQEAASIPAGKTAEALEPIPAAEPFTIAFAGDTMYDWDLRPVLDEHGYDYPFEYVHNEFEKADYSVVNLESTITEREIKTDNGEKGLLDTIEALEAKEMVFIGTGRSDDKAYKAEVVDINGQKSVFLSFTRFFPTSAERHSPDVPA